MQASTFVQVHFETPLSSRRCKEFIKSILSFEVLFCHPDIKFSFLHGWTFSETQLWSPWKATKPILGPNNLGSLTNEHLELVPLCHISHHYLFLTCMCTAEEVVHCSPPERVIPIVYSSNSILWSWTVHHLHNCTHILCHLMTSGEKGSKDRQVKERPNG